MKWFFKWLASKIDDTKYAEKDYDDMQPVASIGSNKISKTRRLSVRESDELSSEPITFRMFKASGGWAVEFRQYDNKNDRMDTSLYVINNEEELGAHISQIITMEALKR